MRLKKESENKLIDNSFGIDKRHIKHKFKIDRKDGKLYYGKTP